MSDNARRRRVDVGERETPVEGNFPDESGDHFADEATPDRFVLRDTPSSHPEGNRHNPNTVRLILLACALLGSAFLFLDPSSSFFSLPATLHNSKGPAHPSEVHHKGKTDVNGVVLYTKEELAKYDGSDPNLPVLLAFMGKVYDVSKGRRHYGPGGSYQFFAGKDATRGFLTGDFKNDLTDDLEGIADSQYGDIENWADTYSKSSLYKQVGLLCGAFYQCMGDKAPAMPTSKLHHAEAKIAQAKEQAAKESAVFAEFPQCNSEWSQDKGGHVWCSEKSGGIERGWTGLPRLFLTQKNGQKSTRCACVHPDKLNDPRVDLYPGCAASAVSCRMQQT